MFKIVSIIIPALNEEKYIGQCLNSISLLEVGNLEIQTIVVDNGSSDKTVEISKKLGAEVLVKSDVNISGLRNLGAKKSKGDLLAFVDSDCVVSKDWLIKATECIINQSVDAVGSFHIISKEAGWIGRTAGLIQIKKVGSEVNYIPSGNMLIKRSAFEAVSGFDESLETTEDVELCQRLKKNGYKLFLDPGIRCTHLGSPQNVKEMFKRELWHGKNSWSIFYNELKEIKNLRVVSYSFVNLILILFTIYGFILYLVTKELWLLGISLPIYLLFNLLVAMMDWRIIRSDLTAIYLYVMIYGMARSLSFFRWIISKDKMGFGK